MSNEYYGGGLKQRLQNTVALGTSTVTTQTRAVGVTRRKCRIKGITFRGTAAPTATTLTAELFARTVAGATGLTLQSAATDIDFASAAAAKTGVAAALTATAANLVLDEGQLIEVTVTAGTASAGPGDLVVDIEYEPVA